MHFGDIIINKCQKNKIFIQKGEKMPCFNIKRISALLAAAAVMLTGCQRVDELQRRADLTSSAEDTAADTEISETEPVFTPPVFGEPQIGGSAVLASDSFGGYTAELEIVGITEMPEDGGGMYKGESACVRLTDRKGSTAVHEIDIKDENGMAIIWADTLQNAVKILQVKQNDSVKYILMLRTAFGDEYKAYDKEKESYRTAFFSCDLGLPASQTVTTAAGEAQLVPYEIAPAFFVKDAPNIDTSAEFSYKCGVTFTDPALGHKITFNTLTHTAVAVKYTEPENPEDDPDNNEKLTEQFTPSQITFINSCAFIGDSTCSSLRLYGFIESRNCYGLMGGAARNIYDFTFEVDGEELGPIDALKKNGAQNLVFLMGINDVNLVSPEQYEDYYEKILKDAEQKCPYARIYILSVSPISAESNFCYNSEIDALNDRLRRLADRRSTRLYIDTSTYLKNGGEGMDPVYATEDGIHMMPEAYYTILTQLCEQAGIK